MHGLTTDRVRRTRTESPPRSRRPKSRSLLGRLAPDDLLRRNTRKTSTIMFATTSTSNFASALERAVAARSSISLERRSIKPNSWSSSCAPEGSLVELLRAGGVTASYQIGTITLSAQQFGLWTGLIKGLTPPSTFTVDAKAACQLMADGGIPVSVGGSSDCTSLSGDLSNVTVGHIWVSANGNLYDPSYKTHILSSGIDIPAAMGCGTRTSSTCGAALVSAGLTGASSGTETSGPDAGLGYVKNINQTAIAAQLQAAAVGVQTAIQGGQSARPYTDVVGGGRLVITPSPTISSSLPYTASAVITITGRHPGSVSYDGRACLRIDDIKPSRSFLRGRIGRTSTFGQLSVGGVHDRHDGGHAAAPAQAALAGCGNNSRGTALIVIPLAHRIKR